MAYSDPLPPYLAKLCRLGVLSVKEAGSLEQATQMAELLGQTEMHLPEAFLPAIKRMNLYQAWCPGPMQ